MKKVIVVLALIISVFALTACTKSETPSLAWADYEVLTYDVEKTGGEKIGEMIVTTERRPADKTLNGVEYKADGRMTIDLVTTDVEMHTAMLFTEKYLVLATAKTYTDKLDSSKSYTLNARHNGKNYYYSLNGGEEKKIKAVATGYTDSEFLYHYIRCYPLTSPPTSLKIADPLNNRLIGLSCASAGTHDIENVNFNGTTKTVRCTLIKVFLADTPQGKPIAVSYAYDSEEYHVAGISAHSSKKIPVQIIENDVAYRLREVKVK